MTDIAASLQRNWLAMAARAPSPHNTQPARWRFNGAVVELWQDGSRWLPAADPQARDYRIALGMAWEALSLAANLDDWRLQAPVFDSAVDAIPSSGLMRVAHAQMSKCADADPLAQWQATRHCWRGRFVNEAQTRAVLTACVAGHEHIATLLPESAIELLSLWHDRAAADLLGDPAVAGELHRWMRYSPATPGWACDGLSADCLLLSRWEARMASVLMRPASLRWLARLGVLRRVVSEQAATRSAAGLVLIRANRDDDPFAAGRAWYRFWLALTAHGLAAVPMSSLADEPASRIRLTRAFPQPEGQVLLNAMRVGLMPAAVPVSARLPVEELLID